VSVTAVAAGSSGLPRAGAHTDPVLNPLRDTHEAFVRRRKSVPCTRLLETRLLEQCSLPLLTRHGEIQIEKKQPRNLGPLRGRGTWVAKTQIQL
jgi:hypothetical protein